MEYQPSYATHDLEVVFLQAKYEEYVLIDNLRNNPDMTHKPQRLTLPSRIVKIKFKGFKSIMQHIIFKSYTYKVNITNLSRKT